VSTEKPLPTSWEMTRPRHEFQGLAARRLALTPEASVGSGPGEAGPGLREGLLQKLLTTLGVPKDPRGIVLACGFAGAGAVGVGVLLPPGDPIGFAYLGVAALGYFFLQTRFLPTFLWLLIAAYGALGGVGGAAGGWVECGLGLLLAAVAVIPPPVDSSPENPYVAHGQKVESPPQNGQSPVAATSATVEDSPKAIRETSASFEESPSAGAGQVVVGQRRLAIRSIGTLQIRAAGQDMTKGLEDKPVLCFLFEYLLARWVLDEPKVVRPALGDELSPGLPGKNQLDRLRKQLYDLQRDIDPALGALVRTDRTSVWLDLSDVDDDVTQLRGLASTVNDDQELISTQDARTIERLLNDMHGKEFLAGFEELERRVTQGRGTAGQVVADARLRLAEYRADLTCALADYQDAIGHPEQAIPHLEDALDALQGRKDLAKRLAVAYLKTGQTKRASEVRRQFAQE